MSSKKRSRAVMHKNKPGLQGGKLVVVLGMHRSGTSALTRGLEVLGVGLGGNLMPAAENNNEKGFFEDIDIAKINDSLLAKLDSSWDRLSLLDGGVLLGDNYKIERHEARRILNDKLVNCSIFAFKDPRASLLLPFWQQVFDDIGLDVGYVISIRNPLSVAASLFKRDGIHEALGVLLWLKYISSALRHTDGMCKVIVDYDRLMLDPEGQLNRIATALSLPGPALNFDALTEYSCEFLSSVLRHNIHGPQHLVDNPSVPSVVCELYRSMLDDSSFFEGGSLGVLIEKLDAFWAQINPFLKDVDTLVRDGRQAKENIIALRNELQVAANGINILQRDLISGNEALQQALNNIDLLKAEIDTKSNRESALTIQLAGLKDECSTLMVELSHRESSIEQTLSHVQHLEGILSVAWSMNDQATREKMALAEQLLYMQAELRRQQELYTQLIASASWRITRPLRALRRHSRQPLFLVRALISTSLRGIWRKLPGQRLKLRLKSTLFKAFSFALRPTKAYQDWVRFNKATELQPTSEGDADVVFESKSLVARPCAYIDEVHKLSEPVQYVPRLVAGPAELASAKVIAFYLPQFHPIPENNQWWGEGFTEWTNVRPAQMQYEGHYQPHVPGDLGYYSLLDVETQRKQVELAKLYGVGGFCFYYYWFAGKRLLETPIEQYLSNPDLDLPFCLCWANENWSRRWDGLDSEILIAQDYSEADDLALIENLARYLKDPRYIRIDGRPLLLVYRPSLLPSARKTAQRWRKWCRENGVGEIYLAYTQSFEAVDPGKYDFDAAIEFPPNNTSPTSVTEHVTPLSGDFAGQVYDYSVYLQRSKRYHDAGYKLFRGVFPSWDNTARRKNKGISFINSSPRGYQEWLVDAIEDTCLSRSNADERLVFVNAWNEWAEGAHLEPDQRYGYGYLEATRMAQLRSHLRFESAKTLGNKLAFVIHAFYPEVFAEIIDYLNEVTDLSVKLFISCPPEVREQVQDLAKCSVHPWVVHVYANHGRDVLPFLKILPSVISEGYEYLIKVHTKKSVHRQDGDVWRRDLYDKLLKPESIKAAADFLAHDPRLGVVGPEGHVVPMGYYWGSNAVTVEKLACRLGARPKDLGNFNFVAGTMFMARSAAFLPLLNLALSDADFESEEGQVDGTLAHAVERAITISAWAAGLSVSTVGAVKANKDYAFAQASI